ncbi:MAG: acyl-ACP--UDP-N-acetylglucosamine O-acyltransferase [Verrucomicrobia bacterium]|nr:acyl-ACP--UDP-N-acetylglucosamine O-acyltransferase [Verrucomicrobiota bacterium]
MIHPTAVIHSGAQLHSSVRVGPHAVIDADVCIGPDCVLGPGVYLTGQTTLGARNRLHAGCVLGDAPQDLKYRGEPTGLRVGDDNVFREHVTVHRSNQPGDVTRIGSNNFLMQHAHVGHNAVLGNHVILAGGALLAGHVEVNDRAFVSGNCLVHQFVRVGELAMMQGGAAISKDLPPYTMARGHNGLCGLNTVGLRRAGFTSDQRLELKRLYHLLFRSGLPLEQALAQARTRFATDAAQCLLAFVASAKRGVCADLGRRGGAEPASDNGD